MLGMAQDYKIEASTPPKILQGRHLIKMGFKPGKAFGEVLRPAYTAQLEGEFKTITEAYFWLGQHQDLLANLAS